MKAPPTHSVLRLAIGTHSPSSQQILALAIFGGATAGLISVSSTTTNKDAKNNNKTKKDIVADDTSSVTTAPHLVQSRATTATAPKLLQPPMSMATIPKIVTLPQILATSDASAERSASLAATTRIEAARDLSGSIGPKKFQTARSLSGKDKVSSVTPTDDNNYDDNSTTTIERKQKPNAFNKRGTQNIEGSNNEGNNSSGSISDQSSRILPPPPTTNDEEEEDDSYPAFTPYHHSLLRKYLTPQIWSKLSTLQTSYGTTIEDIIRAGLALPIGANPPRRVGVLVGDAECYSVFGELLDPIISEYHDIGSYEEWSDPELPMESYFMKKSRDEREHSKTTTAVTAPAVNTSDNTNDYGVIKSCGADEDSDENDDSSFLLDEEDDMFVEYVALPSSSIYNNAPTLDSQTSPPTLPPPSNISQTPSRRNVETIASKAKAKLRRHSTIINNPRLVTNREVDPEGKYVLSTRIRVARSLDGIKFPPTMSRSERRKVERLIQDCTSNFTGSNLAKGTYLPVLSMSNDQNLDLIERHILFDNPNEWTIASGLGRDWPDGRALYANVTNLQAETPDFMIWVNEEDHLRIMCLRQGGDIQGVFITLMNGIRELERELTKRGWHFAYDPRLGYLTSCPTNVGTSMRASVHVRLTNLGRLPGFFELVERLKLEVRGKYGETDRHYTGVFDISNCERLGKSEVHLINVMVEGVCKLIELERRLEAGQEIDLSQILGYDEIPGYRGTH